MKPVEFDYVAPESLALALDALASDGDARPLSGGQSLVPLLNFRLAQPSLLVDLGRITELAGIRDEGGRVLLGAMVRQQDVLESELIRERCPLLQEAIRHVGHPQIRSRGTVGGSVAHADPAAEIPAAVLALGGAIHVVGKVGRRRVEANDFLRGAFTTMLQGGEIVAAIEVPTRRPRSGCACVEVARRAGDYAVCGAAAEIALDQDRTIAAVSVALFGVSDRAVLVCECEGDLVGSDGADVDIEAAALSAARAAHGRDDINGSAEYRRHLAGVVTRRALVRAVERANERMVT